MSLGKTLAAAHGRECKGPQSLQAKSVGTAIAKAAKAVGIDSVVTNRVWSAMGLDPATTLHDVRWGEQYSAGGIDDFVWLFQISGAVPASHLVGGYKGAVSKRHCWRRLGGLRSS